MGAIKKFKMGFYYNQPQGFYYNQQQQPGFYYNQQQPGFYYNQQPGFYYNQQQGFYYDQRDAAAKEGFGEAWKKDKYASKVMDSVIDRASKLLTAHFVANKHEPGPLENRVIGQIAGERMCYEAAEIFMNESSPDPDITAEQISDQLFKFVVKAIDAKGPDKGQAAKK